MKKYIFTLLFLAVTGATIAQTAGIKGSVSDRADQKSVSGATVTLYKQLDSSEVAKTVSAANGGFEFVGLTPDSLFIKIQGLNYQEYVTFVTLRDTIRTLAPIVLDRQDKDLASVTVVARTPPVVIKGDTAQFSAGQFKVNPDATTEDLIKKMPGITVAKDGTVTAQGETVKKVTIDGKDFFGDDASAALKNLPAEVIDKIQVFDRLSDQAQLTGFDDGNSVKAINVVTKSGLKNGRFGRIYAGYGTDDRYSAGGNASFFKGNRRLSLVGNFNNVNLQNFASQDLLGVTSSGSSGGRGGGGGRGGNGGGGVDFNVGQSAGISRTNAFGLNYGNQYGKKVTLTGSYFYNNSRNENQSLTTTQTTVAPLQFTKETSNSVTENTNHRINLRLEYKIDSANSLIFIPSINLQKNNSRSFNDLVSYGGSGSTALTDLKSHIISNQNNDRDGYNIRNNVLFRHGFAKRGRSLSLGFNANFTKNNSDRTSISDNQYYNVGLLIKDSVANKLFDNNADGHTIGGTIAYTEPIGKKSQFQFDYNPSVQINNADQKTYNYDGQKYSALDTVFSNIFENRIVTNNGGVTYRFSPGKDEMFSVGVSYQNTNLQSDRTFPGVTKVRQNFSAVLPNLIWRKKIGTYSNIRVFYRASTQFPSINQLQDVITPSTNGLRATVGNPLLKQSYTQFVSGRYSYTNSKTSNSFFANLFLQTASDYITNALFIPVNADSLIQNGTKSVVLPRNGQLTKPININGYNTVRTFFTYAMPVKFIKSNLNVNAGFSYSRLPGQTNSVTNITNNTVYNAGAVLGSNISEYVDFNVSYNANFNFAYGSVNSRYLNQAAGVSANLLDKKGWFLQNDVSYQVNSGLSAGLNQKYTLWNAALGRKFLKNKVGELKLSVFDLLKQNQSITRTVESYQIVDSQTNVLQRYFLLTFTYNLKNFGTPAKQSQGGNRGEGGARGAGGQQGGGVPGI